MIPSSKWFPTNLQDRDAWFTNFNTVMQGGVGATLGFTVAELLVLAHDWETFDYLATASVTLDNYSEAVRAYRKQLTEGNIGDPAPVFPANITFAMPFDQPTGIFERLDDMVKRIRTAPTYTPETGTLLGINGATKVKIPVGDVPPVIKASVDPGHVIEVKFTRGDSDGIYIEKNVNNAGWAFAKTGNRSPVVIVVPGDGIPQGVQLRARFMDGNEPVGDWSDIVTVQTIP
ncbi:MAG: hypothetical protein JO314_07135 [Acidobacteria bacterium]|nr:hypothetical protein [Acidobacteriota bacterium]